MATPFSEVLDNLRALYMHLFPNQSDLLRLAHAMRQTLVENAPFIRLYDSLSLQKIGKRWRLN
jgi:hypothetical protein